MARPKKIKEELPPTSEDDTLPFVEEDVVKSEEDDYLIKRSIALEAAKKYYSEHADEFVTLNYHQFRQSEQSFLEGLLNVQVSGNWHGPAAGMIRERLKLLKG